MRTDALALRAETIRDLAAAVASLDAPYRAVVLLRYYDALAPRGAAAGTPGTTNPNSEDHHEPTR